MVPHNHRSSRSQMENELWFNMPANPRQQQDSLNTAEQSALQSTSHRIDASSTSSLRQPRTSATFGNSNLNKPLPPAPSELEKKSRKSPSLRSFLRREPPSHIDTTHLRPGPFQQKQRHPNDPSPATEGQLCRHFSRSMPSSPHDPSHVSYRHDPAALPRAHSAASEYPDMMQNQQYLLPPRQHSTRPGQQRAASANAYFEATTPPRSRTYPEFTTSPTARDGASGRPRPHTTWLSPTEPFTDVSQFHLFAEAITGLPNDTETSQTGSPQLQGSLFARRSANDIIPLPLQHQRCSSGTHSARQPVREQRDDWQNFEPPPLVSSRSTSAQSYTLPVPNEPPASYSQWQPPPQMSSVTAELELLGLDDPMGSDNELPDYQQSQAEMAARKRQEASARARELEARWRGNRGR